MSSTPVAAAVPRASAAPPSAGRILVLLAAGYLVAVAALPIQIDRAFGLPAHPLLLHIPVVLIPVLVVAAVAVVARPVWRERYGLAVGVLAVVALIATVLTAGAGEEFLKGRPDSGVLHDHKQAGETLRLVMFGFVAVVLALLATDWWGRARGRLPGGRALVAGLSVLTVVLAAASGFYVVRTGHLGAKATWGHEEGRGDGGGFPGGGPPPGR